jgi:mannose/cellobiose epimerase-like protein (N-acyl-D-glucosamine 2-epimerase family)
MHLTEALMAAFEATSDSTYLAMAGRIAELIIHRHAASNDWRLPEHFTANWEVDRNYSGDPVFRPSGTIPGHWLEWSRLLLQLWELGGRKTDWLLDAAKRLFRQAITEGWNQESGGFSYTLNWDGSPTSPLRIWWPHCEAIGAAAFLNAIDGDDIYESWYRRIWDFTAAHFIDRENGGWHPQLDASFMPTTDPFFGKPDIYHALQACLIPLFRTSRSLTYGIINGEDRASF